MRLLVIYFFFFLSNINLFGQKYHSDLEMYRPGFVGKIRSIITISDNGVKEIKYTRFDEFGNITVNHLTKQLNEEGNLIIDTSAITNEIEYTYNNQGKINYKIVQGGYKSEFHYDLYGNIVEELIYDSLGNKQSHIQNKKEYDTKGNRIETSISWVNSDPGSKKYWRTTFDKKGNRIKRQKLDSKGIPYEIESQWEYDSNNGCTAIKDIELFYGACKINNKITRSKNQLRLLVREEKRTYNNNGDVIKIASYVYHYGNILTSNSCIADAKIIGVDSNEIVYKKSYYDNGKLKEEHIYKDGSFSEYWEFEYDENGREVKSFMFDKERKNEWDILEVVKTTDTKYDDKGSQIEMKIEHFGYEIKQYNYIVTYY